MAKANSFEAEIDEIIRDAIIDGNASPNARRKILNVAIRNIIRLPGTKKLGVPVILTDDFWQALKNSRSDK